jgi:hypothetical protein
MEEEKAGHTADGIENKRKDTNLTSTSLEVDFGISVLQEPVQGRMTGLAESSSRRILDPPLVVQLDIKSIANMKPSDRQLRTIASRFVCSAILYHDAEMEQMAFARLVEGKADDSGFYNNLLGLSCRNCSYFNTPEESRKTLFVFPDLAVRTHGYYRLLCVVSDMRRYKRCRLCIPSLQLS